MLSWRNVRGAIRAALRGRPPVQARARLLSRPPAALVGLIGTRGYLRAVGSVWDMLQSATFMTQLGYGLLQLLIDRCVARPLPCGMGTRMGWGGMGSAAHCSPQTLGRPMGHDRARDPRAPPPSLPPFLLHACRVFGHAIDPALQQPLPSTAAAADCQA